MTSFRSFLKLSFLFLFCLAPVINAYSLTPSNEKKVKQFNRILDDQARKEYAEAIQTLFTTSSEMMKRKIPRANVQQGFVLDTVRNFAQSNSKILSVGCFEDTAYDALVKLGHKVEGIDPEINQDLNTFFNLPTTKKGSYNIIFSTSVIEHVKDDELFLKQISELLAPGGIGVLTCDYEDSWTPEQGVFPSNFRFYTQNDIKQRLLPCLMNCQLIDEPKWDCKNPDFELAGKKYTFATLVFQKRS
jgi:SAM-dependent methyltransferase